MSEKFWYLKKCRLFERLSDDEVQGLEARARMRKVMRGSPVYLPADAADGVLLLVSGRVKICHLTPEGKQSILAFVEPGEVFGELAILDDTSREEYAEAVESSQIVLIPNEMMFQVMERHAYVSMGITKLFGLRRRRIERRIKYLLFRSNRERLVHLVMELAEQYGYRIDDGIELKIKLSHQDLANVIGSTRETVTVLLGELQAAGYVKIGRRKIIVRDLDGMARSVSAEPPDINPDKDVPKKIPTYADL